MIIGLSGLSGSGKTTIAKAIELYCSDRVEVISFASPIKQMIQTLLREVGVVNPQEYTNGGYKNDVLPALGNCSTRHMMQTLGTEWGREWISATLWTDIAMARADKTKAALVVLDDVRFGTEVQAIRKRGGGKIIRLVRDGVGRTSEHSSETLPDYDLQVANNHTPETLAKEILAWLV